jgi:hypothetical protein
MSRRNSKARRGKRIKRKSGRSSSGDNRRRSKLKKRPRKTPKYAPRQGLKKSRKQGKQNRRRPQIAPRPSYPTEIGSFEAAVREMNRGRSLTAAARDSELSRKQLKDYVIRRRLGKRKGERWVTKDNRPRRVPVMTKGRFRVLTVRGYTEARLVGEHHQAVGEFVRTNVIELIEPFKGQSVQTVSGRKYALETDPNALHRIAAMDTPPFHEIYEITSST